MTTAPKIPRETLPSERAEMRDKLMAEEKAKAREESERLARAMAVTFASADGKIVLEWIRKKCYHNVTALSMLPSGGPPSPELTLYRAFQQSLYLDLRAMIPREILKEVEYD